MCIRDSYPEDLFKVQRDLLARYHVDDPGVFFNNDAFWSVPNDPTAPEGRGQLNQPPYYVVAADPETDKPSFQLITPFRGLNREFLSAHMAVSSDPETYGDITVRVLPTLSVIKRWVVPSGFSASWVVSCREVRVEYGICDSVV